MPVSSFGGVIKELQMREAALSSELARVRKALDALTSAGGAARLRSSGDVLAGLGGPRRRRRMSKEARAKISAAQKRRWAKQKAKSA